MSTSEPKKPTATVYDPFTMRQRSAVRTIAVLGALFAFRLAFGLSSDFFFEDQTQIFLIGFRAYATGHWPFFGPDVVWTKSEIPGALQGLLVALPLHIVAAPESPFVLLNVLSFAALCLLAWYVLRALPQLPSWLVYVWFLTTPWALHYSTQIINPSYVLPLAIVFFIGFFEALPVFSLGIVRPTLAFAMMGAAFLSIAQLHMSWPLLLPYVGYSWLARRNEGVRALARDAAAFVGGAVLPFLTLAPTLIRYGLHGGTGGTTENLHLHFVNPWILVTSLARFLSFPSLEISRFIATDGPKRTELLLRHWWLIAPAIVILIAGFVQPLWMLVEMGRPLARWRGAPDPRTKARWRALRVLVAASILLVYFSYWFVMEPAQAHAFYALSPIALVLAAYCWTLVDSPASRRWAAALIALNIAFHAGLAAAQFSERSLYKHRSVVAAAIREKDFEMLGHRRPFAPDAGPYALGAEMPHDPTQDLVIRRVSHVSRFDGSVHWTVDVENSNHRVAYRDLLYIATYRYAGKPDEERHEFIKDIFEPCEARVVELNDGYVTAGFTDATFRFVAAEALKPVCTAAGLCGSCARTQ